MNNYENVCVNNKMSAERPQDSLSVMLKNASDFSRDALGLAQKINAHMFGNRNTPEGENGEPVSCFRDELLYHLNTIEKLLKELVVIAELLGV